MTNPDGHGKEESALILARNTDAGMLNKLRPILVRLWPWIAGATALCLFLLFWFREPIISALQATYALLTERDRIIGFITSFGLAAPLIFMGVQVLQVVFAPIPGEATGFIGGYLFGPFVGCLYSTLALTVGSWINFGIGRFLGRHWVRRMIPDDKLARFDHLLRHQGVLVVFVLFLFPGFPKDYLCLFLGVSKMPMRLFLLMALVGRIPGTLMLSFQGGMVFEKHYFIFISVLIVNLVIIFFGYRYRESLYKWIEKINGRSQAPIDEEEE